MARRAMDIHFLYYEDCPSHEQALLRLKQVMSEEGVAAHVRITRVESDEQARELRFPGSPTIRVDGRDIDPDGEDQPVALTCRVYRKAEGGFTPLPPDHLIRRALRAAH